MLFGSYYTHFYVNWHCLVISIHVLISIHIVFMMNTIREGCGRFNHSLCMQFLVGNFWLNKYMCEGGKGCIQHNIT